MVEIELLSLFPSYVESPLQESILKRAIQKGLLAVRTTDIRAFSTNKHHRVDDRPFGGGPGMLLMPEPVSKAIASVRRPNSKVIYLSPQGTPLNAQLAKELAKESHLILLAGHYEGVDQRVIDEEVDLEVSIGDVVLTNGCLAALVLFDALSRFIPGVLGHSEAASSDSFEDGLLECPHYTKPVTFHEMSVPQVLLGGHHKEISHWKKEQQILRTVEVRPDLLSQLIEQEERVQKPSCTLFSHEMAMLKKWYKQIGPIEEVSAFSGFCVAMDSLSLFFLPSPSSSWATIQVQVNEFALRKLKKNIRQSFPSSIVRETESKLVLLDPEKRLLHFSL